MWRTIALGAGGVGVALAAVWVLFMLGMRAQYTPLLDAVRRMNRTAINPRAMKTAGRPGAHASVVRHVGRTSGTAYATPVVARPTAAGFVIVLPYGTRADWLKNVVAAGRATIVHDGATTAVDRPQVLPVAAADAWFSRREQRNHRRYGVDRVLTVRRAAAA